MYINDIYTYYIFYKFNKITTTFTLNLVINIIIFI